MDNPIYLGDGVYAKFEWGQIRLWTETTDGVQTIFVEREVLNKLIKFA